MVKKTKAGGLRRKAELATRMKGLYRPKTGGPMEKTTLEIQRLHGYTWIHDSKLFGIAFDINISSDPFLEP